MPKLPGPSKEWVLKVEIVDMETGEIDREQHRLQKKDVPKGVSTMSYVTEHLIGMVTHVAQKSTNPKSAKPKTPESGNYLENHK